ncbi:MAG: magnesium transporter, partial [Planctomycetota bacterium]
GIATGTLRRRCHNPDGHPPEVAGKTAVDFIRTPPDNAAGTHTRVETEIPLLTEDKTPQILAWLEQRDFTAVKRELRELEDADIAELIEEFPAEGQAMVFRLLGRDQAAEVFSLLPFESQEALIGHLSDTSVTQIINDMSPDDRTDLLEELPGEVSTRLMGALRGGERRITQALLNYPPDSIGRLMTPEYVSVPADWTAARVLEHIRRVAFQKETVNDIYVVDEHGKLLDHLGLQDIVLAAEDRTVESLMSGPADEPALNAWEDEETAVELFKKYDMAALPVVDSTGVMVGIVTADDVLDLQEEEDTEDFQLMVAVNALEDPYFQTGYGRMMRKRLPWLALLLVAELGTALAIATFEASVRENLHLILLFLPLVNASAGNVGSQMAGLVIRALAVGEMGLADALRVARRELLTGMTLAVTLSVLAFVSTLLFRSPPQVGWILATSMLMTLTTANLAGAMIPLALKRIGLDPAVTSAPLIASLMDIISAIVYFGAATVIFHQFG